VKLNLGRLDLGRLDVDKLDLGKLDVGELDRGEFLSWRAESGGAGRPYLGRQFRTDRS
jgi:hypothetical protein